MIVINPEFHRFLWLNFSPFRLVIMPVILAMVLYIFANGSNIWQVAIFFPALWTYFIVVFVWGNYEAASTSSKEVGLSTWDFQKMSAITPWELAIGKLFGSTSYVWYTGILLLAVLAFSYSFFGESGLEPVYKLYPTPLEPILYLVFAGIMGHASALLLSIGSLRRKDKPGSGLPFVGGFTVSCLIISFTMGIDFKSETLVTAADNIRWHSFSFNPHSFIIGSLLYFFFWILIAIQRNFRSELQYRNSPVVLMAFLITICLYCSGLISSIPHYAPHWKAQMLTAKLFLSFSLLMTATYLTLFMEANNFANYKRWIFALRNRAWKRALEDTPAWIGCLILLAPVYLGLNFLIWHGPEAGIPSWGRNSSSIFALSTSLLLFATRDGLMIHSILAGKIERHKSFMLMLYYLLIYGLIPFIVFSFVDQGTDKLRASLIFYPLWSNSPYNACMPIFTQVLMAYLIFRYTLKSLKD